MAKKISILGSTGSIGKQTLEVVDQHPELFQVEALAAGTNIDLLLQQIRRYHPKKVSVATADLAEKVKLASPHQVQVYYGPEGLEEVSAGSDAEFIVAALVGSVGLQSTLSSIEAGKTIGLANKETLVSAGHIVAAKAKLHQVALLPIDSEHSAIFQCLNGENRQEVNKLIITASGGSFRDRTREQLQGVTVEQALNHPNWSMGAKITIDSATMVNKGLEVIEAHWLFDMPYANIEVVIHPESIIHSMVEFVDYSMVAQLGTPDMRVPIQYALTYPNRVPSPSKPLRLSEIGQLHFRAMDFERFPCLRLAIDCGKAGGTATTVFNAANEAAVARFLRKEIEFLQIESIIEHALNQHELIADPNLEEILAADVWARQVSFQISV
jgi:1-deoxy-D-xylulose-5-phosphate reductoisomerase